MAATRRSDAQSLNPVEKALRERVKELSCLYGIARIVARYDQQLPEILQEIVDLLPMAWQYPEITCARVVLDGQIYTSNRFTAGPHSLKAPVMVAGKDRGTVEVCYRKKGAELPGGAFLEEEKKLIEAVAREVAVAVGAREADEERTRLQQQLQHAERLATIGILSSGVAHELNEPLGNILGYAQLVKTCPGLPDEARSDIEKIENASLHAREVIRNLLLFARQAPSRKQPVDLNDLVRKGIYFFAARCDKQGVRLLQKLDPDLPKVIADPAQMNQMLVNLVVNAIQAMPDGGRLILKTKSKNGHVSLVVEDTGSGMSAEVLEKLYVPFFTTKDVGQGTGLGLPVVHGIVTSHGGSLKVKSSSGRGTRFEILLPVEES
jgi:two-component system, NtrC family, sensor kinase